LDAALVASENDCLGHDFCSGLGDAALLVEAPSYPPDDEHLIVHVKIDRRRWRARPDDGHRLGPTGRARNAYLVRDEAITRGQQPLTRRADKLSDEHDHVQAAVGILAAGPRPLLVSTGRSGETIFGHTLSHVGTSS
jgi:hypothetical protein